MIFDNNFKQKKDKYDFGWHCRRRLPHFDAEEWRFGSAYEKSLPIQ